MSTIFTLEEELTFTSKEESVITERTITRDRWDKNYQNNKQDSFSDRLQQLFTYYIDAI